jgi:hypothetical protein
MKCGESKPTLVYEKVEQTQEFAKGMRNSISMGDSDRRLGGRASFFRRKFE